jgi:hypothetical protein
MPVTAFSSQANAALKGFLELADAWVSRATDDRGAAWFRGAIEESTRATNDRALGMAIGLAPRRLGKAVLVLGADDLARSTTLRRGLDPRGWSVDQLARITLMVASYRDDAGFAERLDRFCANAEINELIALCLGLPVYPAAKLIEPRAREAIRSGMKPVFEAVVHRSPYPYETFAEDDWNQMVVKAVFIEAHLWPIQGLDRRANPQLSKMLVALATERRAAARPISPEVWRCVAPHMDAEAAATMSHVWEEGADKDRLAIALALKAVPDAAAGLAFRDELPAVERKIQTEEVEWRQLA